MTDTPKGRTEDFFHCLDGKIKLQKPLTIKEMNEITAAAWASTQSCYTLASSDHSHRQPD